MIYFFYKRKRNVLALYHKWENEEINHLLKIEKRQRWKNRPEIFRKIWSLIDFFTIFEVTFFILVLIMSIVWIVFNTKYNSKMDITYMEIYNAKQLFNSYKILLSFASICISFNLLSYFFMIKHTLADSKLEILYFLLFYIILILGFVSMSHLTFGPYIKEYHTFGDAMVE